MRGAKFEVPEQLLPPAYAARSDVAKPTKSSRLFLKALGKDVETAKDAKKTQCERTAPPKYRKNNATTRAFWNVVLEYAKQHDYRANLVFQGEEDDEYAARDVSDLEVERNKNERVAAVRLNWEGSQPRRNW